MDEAVIDDLKQFITATMSQQTVQLRKELREDLRKDFSDDFASVREEIRSSHTEIVQKIDNLSESIAEALDVSNQSTDEQLQNHETRITKLEAHAA